VRFLGLQWNQWAGLISVVVATAASIMLREQGRWSLGFPGPAWRASSHLATGLLFSVILIGATDLAVRAFVPSRRLFAGGFPWIELAAVFVPAAVHEELLFRGYIFQKLRRMHRGAAVVLTSSIFALLHAGNHGISPFAGLNLFLGGVLLALAYEWRTALWMPIGLHLGWNLMSGPVFGYAVSGFHPEASIFTTQLAGNELLTGGAFGLEGSVCITVAELAGIFVLARLNRARV
jgi:membrane protease YdiL (CAAX protease family)